MKTVIRILKMVMILAVAAFPAIGFPQEDVVGALDSLAWRQEIGLVTLTPNEVAMVGFFIPVWLDSSTGKVTRLVTYEEVTPLVTYEVAIFDKDGMLVGNTVVEVPPDGFGMVRIAATDITSIHPNPLLTLNGSEAKRIPLENGLLSLRVTLWVHRKGINPFTGEEVIFKAKPARSIVSITTLGTDGATRATTSTVKWFNESKGFGFITPGDGGEGL
jgi:hypothetical protein